MISPTYTNMEIALIKHMAGQGASRTEIAQKLNKTYKGLTQWLQRHGAKYDIPVSNIKDGRGTKPASENIEKAVKPVEVSEKKEVKEKTLADFSCRAMIKYLHDRGYRIRNNELVVLTEVKVNLLDIINS